ncbi:MAG TPA: hypothetical protein DCZ94_19340 [Lentisphaeria bacterium]|nr:MAG: hypothetical protein A2X48_01585 [Lentisphaerae bacterium GWF2_49_21]HBC89099.1 hypothetical protein [Lentisphaeria bacterium]
MNIRASSIHEPGIPKYYQLQEKIFGLIKSGNMKVGDKLPGERELARQFNVAHMTARHAVQTLVNTGVLHKQHGKGTFVANLKKLSVSEIEGKSVSKTVTVVLPAVPKSPKITVTFMRSGILEAVCEAMSEVNYQVNISYFNYSEKSSPLERCISNNPGGVIFWHNETPKNLFMLKELNERGIPFVLVNNYSSEPYDYVVAENRAGSLKVVEYLHELGHRKTAYIDRQENESSVNERRAGFLEGIKKFDMNESENVTMKSDFTEDDMRKCVKDLVDRKFTAIFAHNDMAAISVIEVLREMKIKVPEEMSVVGFDNIDMAQFMTPSLTTVHQDFHEMGRTAAEILLRKMTGNAKNVHGKVKIVPDLIVRESSAMPKDRQYK